VPSMPEDKVTVSFESRVSDLWRGALYVLIHGAGVARLTIVPFLIGLLYSLLFRARGAEIVLVFIISFTGVWSLIATATYVSIRRNHQALRSHRITLDRSAVVYTTADSETRYAWSVFTAVHFRPRGLVLVHQKGRALVWIPFEALANEDEATTLRQLVAESLPMSGSSIATPK
jgi:hypothetical protein